MNPYEAPHEQVEPPVDEALIDLRKEHADAENMIRAFGMLDAVAASFAGVTAACMIPWSPNMPALGCTALALFFAAAGFFNLRLRPAGAWLHWGAFSFMAWGSIYYERTPGLVISLLWGMVHAVTFHSAKALTVFSAPYRDAATRATRAAGVVGRWVRFALLLFCAAGSIVLYVALIPSHYQP